MYACIQEEFNFFFLLIFNAMTDANLILPKKTINWMQVHKNETQTWTFTYIVWRIHEILGH